MFSGAHAGRALIIGFVASLGACGGDSEGDSSAAAPAQQEIADPQNTGAIMPPVCSELHKRAVEQVLGPIQGEARVVRNAENVRPDADGRACTYPIATERGGVLVSVQVDVGGAMEFEQAFRGIGQRVSHEIGEGKPPAPKPRADGWDSVAGLPNLAVWRIGHLAIQIGGQTFFIPKDKLNQLAALIRDGIPDLPISVRGEPRDVGGPDPCKLLTRAEAEGVLGPLRVAPYHSPESVAVVDPNGPGCSYYTANHHALVLTPTLSDGKRLFGMAKGVGGLVGSLMTGGAQPPADEGPWDDQSSGPTGALYFLKGDRMLEVSYITSSTDRAGALALARKAVPRL